MSLASVAAVSSSGNSCNPDNVVNRFLDAYQKMNNELRNAVLDQVLALSSFAQLNHIKDKLDNDILTYVDFIIRLPPELSLAILSYLDTESLLSCCQVCHCWNDFISSVDKLWYAACLRFDIQLGTLMEMNKVSATIDTAKQFFQKMLKLIREMKTSRAFEVSVLQFHTRNVNAVYVWKDKIIAASDDRLISIWIIGSTKPYHVIEVDFAVTCLCADDNLLVAASHVGILAAWDIKNYYKRKDYAQHVGAVLSFDFSWHLDVMISGSVDKTVRLWCLRSTVFKRSLIPHEKWIVKIILGKTLDGTDVFFSMDVDVIFMWTFGQASRFFKDIACVCRIPVHLTDQFLLFTPGLHFDGEHLYHVTQAIEVQHRATLIKHIVASAENDWPFKPQQWKLYSWPVNVKMFLAVGRKYACIVKPHSSQPNVVVLDIATGANVAEWSVPLSRQVTPDCGHIAFGDSKWMHGLDGFNHNGIVMAVGLESGDIFVVKWQHE